MLVGELMYISTNTVPTISFALHALARYMTRATPQHMGIAKQVLRFLKGFVLLGRKLTWCAANVRKPHEPGRIYSYADSSWADVLPSRKSTYGYYLFVNNAAFAWRASLAAILALSTAEAELISICACATEIAYCRKLANELGFLQLKPTILYEDNQGAKLWPSMGILKGDLSITSSVGVSFKITWTPACYPCIIVLENINSLILTQALDLTRPLKDLAKLYMAKSN